MQKKLEDIKFNLTKGMSKELIKFNNLKKELNDKISLYNLDNDDNLLEEINLLHKKVSESRNRFINEFRKNNKSEILEYIKINEKD